MRSDGENVDTALVISVASRYPQQAPPRQVHPLPAPIETMDELRKMEVATLRERVVRSEYEVDSRAVAGAILAHLLAGRPAPSTPGR
jgi:hypothetical protein